MLPLQLRGLYVLLLFGGVLYCYLVGLGFFLWSCSSLLFPYDYCLVVVYSIESGILKFSTAIIELSISLFSSVFLFHIIEGSLVRYICVYNCCIF